MKRKLITLLLTVCFAAFFIKANAQMLTIYSYFKSATGKHFYTTNYSELGNGALGYVLYGELGYVLPTTTPNSTTIYRFYNPTTTAHYYSLNSTPPSGFHFESYLGDSPGFIYANLVTVYQYHDAHGDFYYSTSTTTPTGYTADGYAFNAIAY